MMNLARGMIFLIILSILSAVGCSSSKSNPLTPSNIGDGFSSDSSSADLFDSGNSLIGIWDVVIDPENMTAETLIPRSLDGIGDAFYVDITFFLSGTPCTSCFKIKSIALDADENIVLAISVVHPFEPTTRLDLNVFDLRVLIAWKNAPSVLTFPGVEADVDGSGSPDGPVTGNFGFLLNPDGYSTIFDTIIEPALGDVYPGTLVPFVNMFADPTDGNYDIVANPENGFTDLNNPSGRNVFPMGSDIEVKELVFAPSQDVMEFTMALECAYGQSAIRITRMDPKYFLPEFNRKEAYSAIPTIESNDLLSENPASSAEITISVVDWQAGLQGDPNFDPDTSPLDTIRHNSDVKEVILDIPDIMSTALTATTPDSGTGSFIDPYIFSFNVENLMLAIAGTYVGLVAVRDDMVDVVPGGTNWPPMGIERDGLTQRTIRDFTAYNMFAIEVSGDVVDPPVAIISDPDGDVEISSATLVHFDGSTSTPGGWPDENYEWDFEYDDIGQIFTMDAFGQTVDQIFLNTTDSPIIFVVALRVTDLQFRTDIDTVSVTVNPAGWGTPVRLTFTEDQDDTISLSGDAVVADSSGVAHVIYCEKAIAPDPDNTFRIKYVTYDGVTVSSPEVISGATPFSTPMFGFPQTSPQLPGPSIAIDSSDELHAVWTDIDGIRYARTNGGIWDTSIDTFDLDENPDIVPSIQVSGEDDIMIVWSSRRYIYTNDSKPMPKVHYAYDDGSGMSADTLVEFNNFVGGEPYFCPIGQTEFAMIFADDNPSVPGSENDCFVTRFQRGSWDVQAPVPLDNPSFLRGFIGARESSYDLNIAWSDVLASPATIRFKHYTNDIMTWSNDYNAYDDAFPLALPSPVRIEVLSDGTVFLFWSDTIALKERCLWVSFNENDDEPTILAQTTEEIDPDNPAGERQINSTTRDGKIHVIWQDLRNSSSPGDPKQEIYYCKYE